MPLICPNCPCAIDGAEDPLRDKVRCPECGSTFNPEPTKRRCGSPAAVLAKWYRSRLASPLSHYRIVDKLGGGMGGPDPGPCEAA